MNNTAIKNMKFAIESTAAPVEKDGKTVLNMETKISADVQNASTGQLVGLLAYLGDEALEKTCKEFKNSDKKPEIQKIAEEFAAKRKEMMSNLRRALTSAMLSEMFEAMSKMLAKKEVEEEPKAEESAEEQTPDATVNININVKKEDK
jgi:hypothetical protein